MAEPTETTPAANPAATNPATNPAQPQNAQPNPAQDGNAQPNPAQTDPAQATPPKANGAANGEDKGFASSDAQNKGFASQGAEPTSEDGSFEYQPFTVPEGVDYESLNKGVMDNIRKDFRTLGYNQEKAQEEFTRLYGYHEQLMESHAKDWKADVDAWASKTSELGLNDAHTIQKASNALDAVDFDGKLRKTFAELGLDSHPGIVRVFSHYGSKSTQDTGLSQPGSTAPNAREKTAEEKIWGHLNLPAN